MEDTRNAYEILVGNLKGGDHSEDIGIDGRTVSKPGRPQLESSQS
jgi:hypothetical protein